jgi:hypothetical protein
MNVVNHAEMKALSVRNGSSMRSKWQVLLLLVISVAFGAGGCADYYGGYYGAGYGGGPYYGGGGPYYGGGGPYYGGGGPYYGRGGPYYGGYPGGVTVAVGDRPYYTRGPGYYVGRTYYVWRPGHWGTNRYGQRVWIRGHYVVR